MTDEAQLAERSDASLVPRRQVESSWSDCSVLRVYQPGQRWSVWPFFDGETDAFEGWYVNIEDPHVRMGRTTRSRDHILDVWVEPDRSFQRKDQDELVLAVEQGRYSPGEADNPRNCQRDGGSHPDVGCPVLRRMGVIPAGSITADWRAGIQPDFSHGQPWTSTLPTLVLLRDLGLDPASKAAREMIDLVAENCRWENDGQALFDGEVEPCINGRALSIGANFGADVDGLVRGLLAGQLDDGGWNCETENGATVSSFDSTICVLEGLFDYELAGGAVPVAEARRRGEEYLLERELFRRRSTGEVPAGRWLQFSWPPRRHYDVLRCLGYFRRTGAAPDERVGDAVQLVRDKRQPDDTWLLENTHRGETHFEFEDGEGRPSRWNTLRALRVLNWHDGRR